jgi:Flp pilus assembly pilin Flp
MIVATGADDTESAVAGGRHQKGDLPLAPLPILQNATNVSGKRLLQLSPVRRSQRPPEEVNPLTDFIRGLQADVSDEAGQTMAEYAVVLGVITIAVVVTLGLLSTAIKNLLNNVIASL